MKVLKYILIILMLIIAISSELSSPRNPLVFQNWPSNSKQINLSHKNLAKLSSPGNGKQKGLVIQIRSDKRVPIAIKRAPYHQTAIASAPLAIHRPMLRPYKMAYMQPYHQYFMKGGSHILPKLVRKAPVNFLKIKLTSPHPKPLLASVSEKPYIYEKPSFGLNTNSQNLPIKNSVHFGNNDFAPIHTVPAPNLNLNENLLQYDINNNNIQQLDDEPLYTLPPISNPSQYENHYQVTEFEQTNDQTVIDPISGKHKYFAPDPDPSLPTKKIRPATESFNIPSNGQPLPSDVQKNYLSPQQPSIVQYTNTPVVQTIPAHSYAVPYANHPQFQQFFQLQQTAPVAVYDPTYLVTQSKNLYQQYQNQQQNPLQLFHPNTISVYGNGQLNQEVASNGQILQAAKDFTNLIRPTFNPSTVVDLSTQDTPTFAALVQQQPNHVHNTSPNGGFVVSNYYDNGYENNNPTSYEDYLDLSERQKENDRILAQANLELQRQIQQQLLAQDAPVTSPATSAYEEHQRLLHQQLGSTPLRIFVPDDDFNGTEQKTAIYKRSEEKSTKPVNKKQENSNSEMKIEKNKNKQNNDITDKSESKI